MTSSLTAPYAASSGYDHLSFKQSICHNVWVTDNGCIINLIIGPFHWVYNILSQENIFAHWFRSFKNFLKIVFFKILPKYPFFFWLLSLTAPPRFMFQTEKKVRAKQESEDNAVRMRTNLSIPLLPEKSEDRKLAALLTFQAPECEYYSNSWCYFLILLHRRVVSARQLTSLYMVVPFLMARWNFSQNAARACSAFSCSTKPSCGQKVESRKNF